MTLSDSIAPVADPGAAMSIVRPFPAPGPLVREALAVLTVVASGDEELIEQLGDLEDLPRPWDPDTCPPVIRRQIWQWCDQVAAWINHEYAWRPTMMIPPCWPSHPHLARELPALACQRFATREGIDVAALEEWHRYTLPTFLDRMSGRLGESTCREGRHMDWPAAPRYAAFTSPERVAARGELFALDTPRGGVRSGEGYL